MSLKLNYRWGWVIILALALFLRLYKLELNPVGITHDEIHQIVSAKSIWFTGKEAAGTGAGVFNNDPHCGGNCVFGELPSYLLVPFAALPSSFPWVKLPFLGLSLLIVWLCGKILENLTGNKAVGLVSGLMVAISPWAIFFGRSAYENSFSFVFYLISFYLFTRKKAGVKECLLGIVSGFAASLSYFGAKPIFLPLMMVGIIYVWWSNNRKETVKFVLLAGLILGLIGGYGLALSNSFAGLRLQETGILTQEIVEETNLQRKMSLQIPVVRDLVINKYTVLGKAVFKKYLEVLSPNYLFNEGELGYDHFMIAGHPFLYLIEIPLIILGLILVGKKSKKGLLFIVGVILTMPLTAAISNNGATYALRSGLLFPTLSAIGGAGVVYLLEEVKNKKIKIATVFCLVGVMLISLANFLIMYWYRTPFEKSASWSFFEREAVKYIGLTKKEKPEMKFTIVTNDPVDMMYEYALFSGKINDRSFVDSMNKTIASGEYVLDSVKYTKFCPKNINSDEGYLLSLGSDCMKEDPSTTRMSEPRDGGARWLIPNDNLCNDIKLGSFPFPKKIEEFNIEKMAREQFCSYWVSVPRYN